jgi:transcriptional regulator with XRE-family HTH domain
MNNISANLQAKWTLPGPVQRKLRESQGEQTHRAFAKKLGISVGSLARLKNSPQNVTLATLQKISRALRITPSQLLEDSDIHHRKG